MVCVDFDDTRPETDPNPVSILSPEQGQESSTPGVSGLSVGLPNRVGQVTKVVHNPVYVGLTLK